MQEFMLIYRGGDPAWVTRSAKEKQATMARWSAWFAKLGENGQLVAGGSPLQFSGRRLTKAGVVTDIAASEVKELVSGYSVIKAKNYDDAVALAKECPIFESDSALIEIREIAAM